MAACSIHWLTNGRHATQKWLRYHQRKQSGEEGPIARILDLSPCSAGCLSFSASSRHHMYILVSSDPKSEPFWSDQVFLRFRAVCSNNCLCGYDPIRSEPTILPVSSQCSYCCLSVLDPIQYDQSWQFFLCVWSDRLITMTSEQRLGWMCLSIVSEDMDGMLCWCWCTFFLVSCLSLCIHT
jgi:hypothetical protein